MVVVKLSQKKINKLIDEYNNFTYEDLATDNNDLPFSLKRTPINNKAIEIFIYLVEENIKDTIGKYKKHKISYKGNVYYLPEFYAIEDIPVKVKKKFIFKFLYEKNQDFRQKFEDRYNKVLTNHLILKGLSFVGVFFLFLVLTLYITLRIICYGPSTKARNILISTCTLSHVVEHLSPASTRIQFTFINSSSQFSSITLFRYSSLIAAAYAKSILNILSCVLNIPDSRHSFSFGLVNDGQIYIDKLICPRDKSISPVIECSREEDEIVSDWLIRSSVTIVRSSFRGLSLAAEKGGSIISYGLKDLEEISECDFQNISDLRKNVNHEESLSIFSRMSNSLIRDGVEGIYGEIVGGISSQTVSSFVCSNKFEGRGIMKGGLVI